MIPYSRCGDYELHEPHDDRGRHCFGWTAEQHLVRTLFTTVSEYMFEHYPSRTELPAGLRLEMHPLVHKILWTDLDLTEGGHGFGSVAALFSVPVRITVDDLMPGQWRLVIVTEEVLLGEGANRLD